MQVDNLPHLNKKLIFAAISALLALVAVALWFLVLSKKEAPDTGREIIAPQEESGKIDEIFELPGEVRPLLKESLNEALLDIEALEL